MSSFFRHVPYIQCFTLILACLLHLDPHSQCGNVPLWGHLCKAKATSTLLFQCLQVGCAPWSSHRLRSPAIWMCQVLQAPAGTLCLWARCPGLLSRQWDAKWRSVLEAARVSKFLSVQFMSPNSLDPLQNWTQMRTLHHPRIQEFFASFPISWERAYPVIDLIKSKYMSSLVFLPLIHLRRKIPCEGSSL